MEIRYPEIEVQLSGEDGNAFSVMGRVVKALRRDGHGDSVDEYTEEATSGDYDHLVQTTTRWVTVL